MQNIRISEVVVEDEDRRGVEASATAKKVAVIGGSARANALELSERLVEGKTGDDAPPYVGDF